MIHLFGKFVKVSLHCLTKYFYRKSFNVIHFFRIQSLLIIIKYSIYSRPILEMNIPNCHYLNDKLKDAPSFDLTWILKDLVTSGCPAVYTVYLTSIQKLELLHD